MWCTTRWAIFQPECHEEQLNFLPLRLFETGWWWAGRNLPKTSFHFRNHYRYIPEAPALEGIKCRSLAGLFFLYGKNCHRKIIARNAKEGMQVSLVKATASFLNRESRNYTLSKGQTRSKCGWHLRCVRHRRLWDRWYNCWFENPRVWSPSQLMSRQSACCSRSTTPLSLAKKESMSPRSVFANVWKRKQKKTWRFGWKIRILLMLLLSTDVVFSTCLF